MRQIASVASTIRALGGEEELMAEKMFDGFDHTQYEDEVTERWGADAYATGDRWWRSMSAKEKAAQRQTVADLGRDWAAAAESGIAPGSDEAQALARRHVEWLRSVPGAPMGDDASEYVTGLGDMYVADPRFGENYATRDGGTKGAEFVRDALRAYAVANL